MKSATGSVLVSFDVETTGLDPDTHEVWSLAAIVVDANLKMDKKYPILDLLIAPETQGGDELGVDWKKVMGEGVPKEVALRLFEQWCNRCGFGLTRRMVPLAQNWKFDSNFIRKFIGFDTFSDLFDARHRDTLQVAIAINDAHELAGLEYPYRKLTLSSLCKQHDIKLQNAHTALEDAAATIELYRILVKQISEGL